jgi:anti-anti-sigma factor
VIGVALSLGWLIYVATRPAIPVVGREPGTQVFRDLVENPDDETLPRLVVLRLDGGLFFATAEALEDRIRELQDGADPPLRTLVLDLEGVNFIDAQGAAKLTEIEELTDSEGISLRLARVKPNVRSVLQVDGLIDRLGNDHIHGNVHRAVEASVDGGGSTDGR